MLVPPTRRVHSSKWDLFPTIFPQDSGCYNTPPHKLYFVLKIIPYHPRHTRHHDEDKRNREHTTAFPRLLNPTLAYLSKTDVE